MNPTAEHEVAELDFAQDVLSGLNVKAGNYLDLRYFDAGEAILERPAAWAVMAYDEGLDYDADGNAYFDDYPGWFAVSYHRTLRGAEMEAAWLEDRNVGPLNIEEAWLDEYWATIED